MRIDGDFFFANLNTIYILLGAYLGEDPQNHLTFVVKK
jgi:hypothetical protein